MFTILSETDCRTEHHIYTFLVLREAISSVLKKGTNIHNCEKKKFGVNIQRMRYD